MLKIQRFVQPTQIAIKKAHIYLGGLGSDAMLRSRTSSLQLAVHLWIYDENCLSCRASLHSKLIAISDQDFKQLYWEPERFKGDKVLLSWTKKKDFILTFCTQRQSLPNDVLDATWRHSPAKNVYACSGKNDTWSISSNVIGSEAKMPGKCWDERSDGSFFLGSDSVAISCHCKRSKIILVKVLT